MEIALFHTGQSLVGTFDNLLDDLGYTGKRIHRVREDLLAKARDTGLDSARPEILDELRGLLSADAVLCTCSTIGPCTDEIARDHAHVIRVDRPAMEEACTHGPDVLMVICLESTRGPSLALLEESARSGGRAISPRVLLCDAAWPLFVRGETEAFGRAVADRIRAETESRRPDCIILAQASMRPAEDHLTDLGIPVISTPPPAAARLVELATLHALDR